MAVNGILHLWNSAPKGEMIKLIEKTDEKVLDSILQAQARAKVGIFKSTPWNITPREMQEIGTKLGYRDMLNSKIESLYSKYPTETKVFKRVKDDKEFVVFKGSQEGSNEGYWAQVKDTGELYYIKFGSEAQIRSEQLAGDLYKLGGVSSPQLDLVALPLTNGTEKFGIASKWKPVNGLPEEYDAPTVREGFGMDCWLANWDSLKSGNTVMSAGNATRLDVGGSLCYRARGGRKGAAFGENVNELTSFFESFSHSKPYIKDMTRDELIGSLGRVSSISDSKIISTVDNAAQYKTLPAYNSKTRKYDKTRTVITGIKNPNYLQEILLARKSYITEFRQKCLETPQKAGETIEQYIKRIDSSMSKKSYDVPFEKIEMSDQCTDGVKGFLLAERLSPSQKKIYEDSYHAFKTSAKNTVAVPYTGNHLTEDLMLHSTSPDSLKDILRGGITSGDCRGSIGAGTGCTTQTPLCADFWDIQGSNSIKDYFSRVRYNDGEANFLPKAGLGGLSNTRRSMVFVVNKNAVAPTIMRNSFKVSEGGRGSILYKDGNMAGHENYITHRAVPIGVPANAIEKIIIRKDAFSTEEIAAIKRTIKYSGKNIRLYDLDGNLL